MRIIARAKAKSAGKSRSNYFGLDTSVAGAEKWPEYYFTATSDPGSLVTFKRRKNVAVFLRSGTESFHQGGGTVDWAANTTFVP